MNKIQLGEKLQNIYKGHDWKALKEMIDKKIHQQKNKMAVGLDREEYLIAVGRVKGLQAIEIGIKKAIQEKNNLIKKRDEQHNNKHNATK